MAAPGPQSLATLGPANAGAAIKQKIVLIATPREATGRKEKHGRDTARSAEVALVR